MNDKPFLAMLTGLILAATPSSPAQQVVYTEWMQSELREMKAFPEGRYRLNLELGGRKPRIDLEISSNIVRTIKSSDPDLERMEGSVKPLRPGVFLVTMRNTKHTLSQFWIFRKDGSAAVREVPDRGEMQLATPVKDDSIDQAK